MKINEPIKAFLLDNAATLIVAGLSVLFFVFGYILSIRSDLNATILHVQALEQSNTSLLPLIPEVAQIKQLSQDTNDKINLLVGRKLNQ